ncbi:hypothetical protein ACFQZX_00595 [Mucilaginibacter litoreus]|uniref:Vitellogenin II n=1 Tax=Mucilaginibacter litoreus TaxID=1048221 RepID=A0ABW3AMS2_9SPHI
MKRNLVLGIIFFGAAALSSCSVNKTASTSRNSDDMYYTKATATEAPEYVAYNQEANTDDQYDDEDDYFYYDDYASRINRFSYYSPFSYYDTGYWGYGYPYYGSGWNLGVGLGYGGYGGLGWNVGLSYGWGSPWGYGWGSPWAYSPWGYGYYSPYSYWGTGWGGGYWGIYSAYNRGTARPYRGNGTNGSTYGNRARSAYGNAGNSGIGYIPNRGRNVNGNTSTGRPSYGDPRATRGVRSERPVYRPDVQRSSPQPSSYGGGGGGGGSVGGGGGGRPVRH